MKMSKGLKILLWIAILTSVFNVGATVQDIWAGHVTLHLTSTREKRLYVFHPSDLVICYYLESNLDANPTLSCIKEK